MTLSLVVSNANVLSVALFITMISVIILSVITLNAIMLSVVVPAAYIYSLLSSFRRIGQEFVPLPVNLTQYLNTCRRQTLQLIFASTI
jgi:hypothetical protein